jgi:hypothetical protein
MRRLLIPAVAATLTAAALLTAGTAISASASTPRIYVGYGTGTGATSPAAEDAAIGNLNLVNVDCFEGTLTLIYDTLQPSGIWQAEVSEKCVTPNNQ